MATRSFALGKFAINDHRTASTELGGLARLTPVIEPMSLPPPVAAEGGTLAADWPIIEPVNEPTHVPRPPPNCRQ